MVWQRNGQEIAMPFDGVDFPAPTAPNTGLFPAWSKQGCRLRFQTGFRRDGRERAARTFLRAPSPSDRGAAIMQLLQDAKGLIENPAQWTKGAYRSFGGRRCAVGALRAAARRLHDPRLAWSAHALLIDIAIARGFTNVEAMNDRSSHDAVLGAFRRGDRGCSQRCVGGTGGDRGRLGCGCGRPCCQSRRSPARSEQPGCRIHPRRQIHPGAELLGKGACRISHDGDRDAGYRSAHQAPRLSRIHSHRSAIAPVFHSAARESESMARL